MNVRRVWTILIQSVMALAVLVLYPPMAAAQFETTAVVGTIFDKQNAAVAGAKVTLTNTATGVTASTMTDTTGGYEFVTVRIGTYIVTAEKTGFSLVLADNVQISIGGRPMPVSHSATRRATRCVVRCSGSSTWSCPSASPCRGRAVIWSCGSRRSTF